MVGIFILLVAVIFATWWACQESSTDRDQQAGSPENDCNRKAYKNKARSESDLKEHIYELPIARGDFVIDGDTVVVTRGWSEIRIRLDSIDCPEDGQYWGDTARYGLIKLVGGRKVYLEEHGIDSYGRTLATIYVWNTDKQEWLNVNERMVTLGHAWVMRQFYDHLPKDRQDKLDRLEKWARSRRVGLWRQENPIPPWEWREEALRKA